MGGPYSIGVFNTAIIVAENGDDADYNDTILEFTNKAGELSCRYSVSLVYQ